MTKKKKHTDRVHKNSRKKTRVEEREYKGVVDIARSGMAFVMVEGLEKDILVRGKHLGTALSGDEVRVKVVHQAKDKGRMEGVITEVVKRRKLEFTGRLELNKNFGFVVTDEKSLPDVFVPLKAIGEAQEGDRVVVRITHWGEKTRKPMGEIVAVLNQEDANDMAMKEILVESGFPLSFPEEVLEEAARLPEVLPASEIKKRKDCRDLLTFTIDPFDAKDFDDAISVRRLKNGYYEIGVHIADVSHYVTPETPLDREAEKRATSVYLADRVLPMLPERISNELCSLRPHEDKFCFSAIFQINEKAAIKQYWLGKTVIHSDHRFTYEEVQEVIENQKGQYAEELLLLNRIAQQLRKQRFEHGAINFSSQELKFVLDEQARPVGITIKESKEAHQLIEELMLLANKTVAEHVSKLRFNKQEVPFVYRVHDQPDEEKLKVFTTFALKFGYRFDTSDPRSIARSFNEMLHMVQGRPEQHVLETLGIRTMAKAVYTTENIGHYGLGFDYYCHFTSPIRRYPDVLVHRILHQCLQNEIHPEKQLEKRCRHCSEMERKAMEAERAANKYKQVEYMQKFVGEEFDGVVSGVAHFGFWVETVETKCEGLVGIQQLLDVDEFHLSESEYALIGIRTGLRFRIGDTVKIRVVAAHLHKRQLDYELVSKIKEPEDVAKRTKKKKNK